ncbi:MAG TPA: cytochrome C, partial [Thermoanaerobaculia bacterium]|nr:cytochrome C [Thermoanaerobaculia bacterium]
DFPVRLFVKMAPRDLDGPVLEPDRSDPVHYGEYLATISGCKFCHTPVDDRNQPVRGQAFAGGQEFRGPWGTVRSSNLTPHVTGLGERGRESFIGLFRVYNDPGAAVPAPAGRNTVMPWLSLAGMTDDDLGAIYEYLLTVPPIENTVERFPPAAP